MHLLDMLDELLILSLSSFLLLSLLPRQRTFYAGISNMSQSRKSDLLVELWISLFYAKNIGTDHLLLSNVDGHTFLAIRLQLYGPLMFFDLLEFRRWRLCSFSNWCLLTAIIHFKRCLRIFLSLSYLVDVSSLKFTQTCLKNRCAVCCLAMVFLHCWICWLWPKCSCFASRSLVPWSGDIGMGLDTCLLI